MKLTALVYFIPLIIVLESQKLLLYRIDLIYFNKKFISDVELNVKKYSRSSDYYYNFKGTLLKAWDKNVTINIIFYEFVMGRYRRHFFEVHFGLCDAFDKPPTAPSTAIGTAEFDPHLFIKESAKKTLKMVGITSCPLIPKTYKVYNTTLPAPDYSIVRYVWPFEKARVDIYTQLTDSKEILYNCTLYFTYNKKTKKP